MMATNRNRAPPRSLACPRSGSDKTSLPGVAVAVADEFNGVPRKRGLLETFWFSRVEDPGATAASCVISCIIAPSKGKVQKFHLYV